MEEERNQTGAQQPSPASQENPGPAPAGGGQPQNWYRGISRDQMKKNTERFNSWADSYLGKSVTGQGKISWGLVILGLAAVYAIIKLVQGVIFFFG